MLATNGILEEEWGLKNFTYGGRISNKGIIQGSCVAIYSSLA